MWTSSVQDKPASWRYWCSSCSVDTESGTPSTPGSTMLHADQLLLAPTLPWAVMRFW
jgi:hypothetical protein